MYVSVQFLFLFFLRFFPFLLFFHLPWPWVYAGKWLSWVESLMLFAEMFKLYTGICKKKNKTNKKKKQKTNSAYTESLYVLLWRICFSSFGLCSVLAARYMSRIEQSFSCYVHGSLWVWWSEISLCPLEMKRRFNTLLF